MDSHEVFETCERFENQFSFVSFGCTIKLPPNIFDIGEILCNINHFFKELVAR